MQIDEKNFLASQFETHRAHLRGAAYRMLGSLSEADDAVQEAWLRLSQADGSEIRNLRGWLTTVVARVCLDMLRSRKSRREEPIAPSNAPRASASAEAKSESSPANPEEEAALADSIGLALLVVLHALPPAERVAFVLHDMFDLPFDEIGEIVGRTEVAARQLASRARSRVRGLDRPPVPDLASQRRVVEAFLVAARGGDLGALVTLLDPNVVMRADKVAAQAGGPDELRGAAAVAGFFSGRAQAARPVLIDGALGLVVAPRGKVLLVITLELVEGKIAAIRAVADPARLEQLELALVEG